MFHMALHGHAILLGAQTLNAYVPLAAFSTCVLLLLDIPGTFGITGASAGALKFSLLCLAINFVLTAAYHLLCSHPPLYHIASALDLIGLGLPGVAMLLLIVVDKRVVPTALASYSPWQLVAPFVLYNVLFGACVFVYRIRRARESPFALLLACMAPTVLFGVVFLRFRTDSWLVMVGLACFGVGALLFASKFPERAWPLRFDVVGSSHQLWHCLYTMACFFMLFDTAAVLASEHCRFSA